MAKDNQPRVNSGKFGATYGGEKAVKALTHGEPLTGLAAAAQADVETRLETEGRESIMRLNAIRTQAAAELYWNAIQKAAQDGDLAALDQYIARFGWLSGVAMRAWQTLAANERGKTSATVLDVLQSMKGGDNDGE